MLKSFGFELLVPKYTSMFSLTFTNPTKTCWMSRNQDFELCIFSVSNQWVQLQFRSLCPDLCVVCVCSLSLCPDLCVVCVCSLSLCPDLCVVCVPNLDSMHCSAPRCTEVQCTALYCTVLYCTVLYCTVLYCTVLYCTVLYCTVLYCTVLRCSALGQTVVSHGKHTENKKASENLDN